MIKPMEYDVFVGLDVHKKSYSFTVTDRAMNMRSKKVPADPKKFERYVTKEFKGKKLVCAYEAGPTGYGLHDHLKNVGVRCLVVPAMSLRKERNMRVKNDRIDSKNIAEELRSGHLSSIRVPEDRYRELRHLLGVREQYVLLRKKSKQRIRSVLLHTDLFRELPNEEEGSWSNRSIQKIRELKGCSPAVRLRLDMLLSDLEHARKQNAMVLKVLRELAKNDAEIGKNVGYLLSLPGFGMITAVSILGRIGDPRDLKNVREMGSFLGLVPSEKSTGERVTRGAITHLGNKRLRALLVEIAWIAIRKDTELKQFFHRIKARHHPSIGARKAIVAVARKLTTRVYAVLKEQRFYMTR